MERPWWSTTTRLKNKEESKSKMPSIRLISKSIKLNKWEPSISMISPVILIWLKFFSNCWTSCNKTKPWMLISITLKEIWWEDNREDHITMLEDKDLTTTKEVQWTKTKTWWPANNNKWDNQCHQWLIMVCHLLQTVEFQPKHQCLQWCHLKHQWDNQQCKHPAQSLPNTWELPPNWFHPSPRETLTWRKE